MRLIDADKLPKCDGYVLSAVELAKAVENAPTVEAEPIKSGKWMWLDGVRCSICNYKLQSTGLPTYCPNCGARMMDASADACKVENRPIDERKDEGRIIYRLEKIEAQMDYLGCSVEYLKGVTEAQAERLAKIRKAFNE